MTTDTEYISPADTAKYVRKELRQNFPGVKFSVRTSTYSGGASIDVSWTDGPCDQHVSRVAKRFEGSDFDGMIDLKTFNDHWILPDGTVQLAHARGTEGSHGSIAEVITPRPIQARRVHFGANFVFTNRHITDWEAKTERAAATIRTEGKCEGAEPNDQFGNTWISDLASNAMRTQHETESIEEAARRYAFGQRAQCPESCPAAN